MGNCWAAGSWIVDSWGPVGTEWIQFSGSTLVLVISLPIFHIVTV